MSDSVSSGATGEPACRSGIPPVPEGAPRPLWSVMIPTYHCAGHLRETLECVLSQDPGPDRMQIEVVDDGSTADDPERVVREVGKGRVGFFRQPRNVGHVANFNTCLKRARGHLVHLLHGDDAVRDGFYRAHEAAFATHPETGAAFCRYIKVDERGHWRSLAPLQQPESGLLPDALERLASDQRVQPPSIVVRRSVYEHLGGFDGRFTCSGEDWEMWVRIAAHYPIWYEAQPLALYRTHTGSLTGRSKRTGANIRETRLAIKVFGDLLPPDRARSVRASAREAVGLWALATAGQMLRCNDPSAALVQVREGLRCSRSFRILARLSFLAIWFAVRGVPRVIARGARARSNGLATGASPGQETGLQLRRGESTRAVPLRRIG